MKRDFTDFTKGMRVMWLPILLAAFCLVPATGFANPVGAPCSALSSFDTSFTLNESKLGLPPASAILPYCVVPGTVAMLENPSGLNVPSNWSDLAVFTNTLNVLSGNIISTVTLYSDRETTFPFTSADVAIPENPITGTGNYIASSSASEPINTNCLLYTYVLGFLVCVQYGPPFTITHTISYTFQSEGSASTPVPEPATLSLMVMGLALLAVARRVRQKN